MACAISFVECGIIGVVEATRSPARCTRSDWSKPYLYVQISAISSGMYENVFCSFVGTTSQRLVLLRNTHDTDHLQLKDDQDACCDPELPIVFEHGRPGHCRMYEYYRGI